MTPLPPPPFVTRWNYSNSVVFALRLRLTVVVSLQHAHAKTTTEMMLNEIVHTGAPNCRAIQQSPPVPDPDQKPQGILPSPILIELGFTFSCLSKISHFCLLFLYLFESTCVLPYRVYSPG